MSPEPNADPGHVRSVVLEVIEGLLKEYGNGNLQSGAVLQRAAPRLGRSRDLQEQQALLASFYDLFRVGYLSWGADLANPAPTLESNGYWVLEMLTPRWLLVDPYSWCRYRKLSGVR